MNLALGLGVVVVGWIVFTFNRLTRLRQLGDNAWADIDVQLKRRHDLIPNVVAVVQGHAGYERGTLEALVAARGRAIQVTTRGAAPRRTRRRAPRQCVAAGRGGRRSVSRAQSSRELRGTADDADGRRRPPAE